jgi:HlyD family secretion protein
MTTHFFKSFAHCLATCSLLALLSTQALAADPPKSGRAGMTITTTHPQASGIQSYLRANGNIAAWQEASVASEIGGIKLKELLVNVGDVVRRDDVLARFATETVEADLAVVRAAETEARAALAEAKTNAARANSLKNSGALSNQQIGQYLTAELTAKAKLEAARSQVKVLELRLKKTQVLAPDDGEIISRQATLGAVIPVGTELFRILRQSRLEWRAEVTSEELGKIQPGMQVRIVPASLAPGQPPITGTVRIIGPTVDQQSRTAIVYVDLPPQKQDAAVIRAGMFAQGELLLGEKQSLTLPQESIVTRDGFTYVFKVGANRVVTQTKITIGQRLESRVEILTGVTAEDLIAESGAGFLADGDLVTTVEPTPSEQGQKQAAE